VERNLRITLQDKGVKSQAAAKVIPKENASVLITNGVKNFQMGHQKECPCEANPMCDISAINGHLRFLAAK